MNDKTTTEARKELKQRIYQSCKTRLLEKEKIFSEEIRSLDDALQAETKSSAGDKYETGRDMINLEREKLGRAWANIQDMLGSLLKIDMSKISNKVEPGSLVGANQKIYFISVSLGPLKMEDHDVIAISRSSPLASVIMDHVVGDECTFNGHSFTIDWIC